MFKKIIVLLFAIILMLTVSGCYSKDDISAARADGYDAGYHAGYGAGDTSGYNRGFADGSGVKPGFDSAYDEGYHDGYEQGYSNGYKQGSGGYDTQKPVSRPASGEILSGREYYESEITVIASSDCDYVVSLKDIMGKEYVCFYVRAGDTVTVGVPANYLYVYFASGKDWYGYGKGLMFGEDTSYSKDDEVTDFTESTWEYTLHTVQNGNFSEAPSNEDEFF